jgi:hypothetical protein
MARQRLKKIAVAFYRTAAGAEPVKAWLWSLSDEDRKIIGDDLRTVQLWMAVGIEAAILQITWQGALGNSQ